MTRNGGCSGPAVAAAVTTVVGAILYALGAIFALVGVHFKKRPSEENLDDTSDDVPRHGPDALPGHVSGPARREPGGAGARAWHLEPGRKNIRDFASDKHRSVDDTPAGGGAGMVLRPDVLTAAIDSVADGRPMLALTPRGAPLTQARVRELAAGQGVILLSGRFEGFDERIFDARPLEPVSIGDYVLSGGELGAMVILDACVRLLPGVMGAASSGEEESFEQGLLEYPHYTRPVTWEGRTIPEVLRSGDHAKIAAWRHERAVEDTRLRRPDLIERHGGASQAPPSGARRRDTKAVENEPD